MAFQTEPQTSLKAGFLGAIAERHQGAHEVSTMTANAETAPALVVSRNAAGNAVIGGSNAVGVSLDQSYIQNATADGNAPANGDVPVMRKGYAFMTAPANVNPTTAVRYLTATGLLTTSTSNSAVLEGASYETVASSGELVVVRLNS